MVVVGAAEIVHYAYNVPFRYIQRLKIAVKSCPIGSKQKTYVGMTVEKCLDLDIKLMPTFRQLFPDIDILFYIQTEKFR